MGKTNQVNSASVIPAAWGEQLHGNVVICTDSHATDVYTLAGAPVGCVAETQ